MNIDYEKIKITLNQILSKSSKNLSQGEIQDIQESIDAGEWQVAFETLVTQLFEYNILLNTDFYDQLKECGKLIGVDPSYWLPLKNNVQRQA